MALVSQRVRRCPDVVHTCLLLRTLCAREYVCVLEHDLLHVPHTDTHTHYMHMCKYKPFNSDD